MTSSSILGHSPSNNFACSVSPQRLIITRMLIQANSGGGKSYLIRKLVETLYGKVQILILDIEGEFASLRSHYDFIVAGKGGDIAADPRYAEALARKFLELKSDLIVDLYELKQPERIRFVKLFFDAMISAPKELWQPVLVVLDEAHLFAPEKSSAESLSAVIDMASRGRKRGFCLVAATQRPSKLDKDVAAECQNKLIGLANMELDRKRGAEELGFTDKSMILSLRDLPPGAFYSVGPAFSHRGVQLIQVGETQTEHPEAGLRALKSHTPAPSKKVREQLAKLADLPKEVEEEATELQRLRTKVMELERLRKQLAQSGASPLPVLPPKKMKKEIKQWIKKAAEQERKKLETSVIAQAVKIVTRAQDEIRKLSGTELKAASISPPPTSIFEKREASAFVGELEKKPRASSPHLQPSLMNAPSETLGQCERRILSFLSLDPEREFTKVQTAVLTGYAHSSGGFANALSTLSSSQLISRDRGLLKALTKPERLESLIPFPLGEWGRKVGQCERRILAQLLEFPDTVYTRDELAKLTEYEPTSGGFANALSHLSGLGILHRESGRLRLNPELRAWA